MASTLVKNDIHIVFHVKSTSCRIDANLLPTLYRYIGGIINRRNGLAIEIGGMPDHVHILTALPKTLSLADYVRDIKAVSSKWIKSQGVQYARFEGLWRFFRQSHIAGQDYRLYPYSIRTPHEENISGGIQTIFGCISNRL